MRSTTTQILTNAATPLSSHTIHTQAESIKQAGGNISQFNSALPDALPPKQNITFTSHSSSHRNERHAARSCVRARSSWTVVIFSQVDFQDSMISLRTIGRGSPGFAMLLKDLILSLVKS